MKEEGHARVADELRVGGCGVFRKLQSEVSTDFGRRVRDRTMKREERTVEISSWIAVTRDCEVGVRCWRVSWRLSTLLVAFMID